MTFRTRTLTRLRDRLLLFVLRCLTQSVRTSTTIAKFPMNRPGAALMPTRHLPCRTHAVECCTSAAPCRSALCLPQRLPHDAGNAYGCRVPSRLCRKVEPSCCCAAADSRASMAGCRDGLGPCRLQCRHRSISAGHVLHTVPPRTNKCRSRAWRGLRTHLRRPRGPRDMPPRHPG